LLQNKEAGEGVWVDYISKHAPKRAYAEKVTDEKGVNYFIACGYYPDITKDTTINLVRRGYEFMKSNGVSVALKEFGEGQDDPYRYGDLALFVYDMKGTCLAHGKNRDLVGQNLWDYKDADGRYNVRELINQANVGGGWVNFKINNSFQSTYVEKIDMGVGEYVIGAGMFAVSKPETMELLVKSALTYLNNNSMEQFLERLVNRNDEFLRGDLFMYVFDLDGVCYGWADNYTLIWQQLINWRDENGKPFVKQMIDSSQKGPDHLILKMNKRQRVNYFEQIEKNGKKYLVGSGFYK
jgi:cytochrome c